jgi:RNA polymerase sigma-70 factor (ECF subfamily)
MPSLLALARRLTRSQFEAEDLVQDTLVKAIRAREQYQSGTNLRAWLMRILKNTFINRYHRGQLERATLSASLADPVVDGWMGSASVLSMRDPESCLLRPQLEQHINAAIDELPEEFRVVVLLADVEGFAYREIAETLGCPIGTVMSRLHRARRALKVKLVEHARELGLVGPEPEVGGAYDPKPSDRKSSDRKPGDPKADDPIDLQAYRDGARSSEASRGKATGGRS